MISQEEAEEIYYDQEKTIKVHGMRWVRHMRREQKYFEMPKSVVVKYSTNYYEVGSTRIPPSAEELNYGRRYWGHKDIAPVGDVEGRRRARGRMDAGPKPEVPRMNEKEKRAECREDEAM